MKRDSSTAASVVVPGVVSIAASSRRTLKDGDTFAMFDELGDIVEVERSPAGLFHFDTRHLSRLHLTLEGHRPLMLSSTVQHDNVTLDVDVTNPDIFDGERLVLEKDAFHIARAKFLWRGACQELLVITSFSQVKQRLRLALDFDADFADLFEIRGYPRAGRGAVSAQVLGPAEVLFTYSSLDGMPRATRISFSPAPQQLTPHRAEFELELAGRERRCLALSIHCERGTAPAEAPKPFFSSLRRARRSRAGSRTGATLETSNNVVNSIMSRSSADLEMLMTGTPHGPYPYAGVPWFSTPFGRDGIITAIEMLWFDPTIAGGVLRFLAQTQATAEDPAADMEPGKIVHELRECELARLGEVPFGRYYGSVDATPLFVALAGMYWQRTRDRATLEAIWPNVLAALGWIERYGDRDGDGFVEYGRMRDSGLRNQGWKDSDDAVFHADGRLARGPIALCEVQAYVYMALRLAGEVAADLDELALSRSLYQRSDILRARFDAAFWDDELGSYCLALDGEKQPCRVRTSNAAHTLFTGIALPERAARLARQMLGRDFFSGWGIRTVAAGEKLYNPISYHNGSVWPHDNALIALGLAHYGFTADALTLAQGLFDAAAHMHLRRLPELFCGFEKRRGKSPTPYPVACAPQAWAACTPFALLQACLGIEVDGASSTLILRRPRLPHFIDWLTVRRLPVGDGSLDLMFRRHDGSVAVNLLSRDGDAQVEVML